MIALHGRCWHLLIHAFFDAKFITIYVIHASSLWKHYMKWRRNSIDNLAHMPHIKSGILHLFLVLFWSNCHRVFNFFLFYTIHSHPFHRGRLRKGPFIYSLHASIVLIHHPQHVRLYTYSEEFAPNIHTHTRTFRGFYQTFLHLMALT